MQLSELRTELITLLGTSATGSTWTTAILNSIINRANRWACGQFSWPYTEGAKYTTSVAAQTYYDYDATFQSDSLYRLTVQPSGGVEEEYTKLNFNEFEHYRLANPSGQTKYFTDNIREIFIWPVIGNSTSTIRMWAQQVPATLSADGDKSPLSYGEQVLEEGLIAYAMALALERRDQGPSPQSAAYRQTAREILQGGYDRIQSRQQQYKTRSRPLLSPVDLLSVGRAHRRFQQYDESLP